MCTLVDLISKMIMLASEPPPPTPNLFINNLPKCCPLVVEKLHLVVVFG